MRLTLHGIVQDSESEEEERLIARKSEKKVVEVEVNILSCTSLISLALYLPATVHFD